mmetsp:Transcript_46810/g.94439  ORF Transcript_46810/g.94439 Transcript_46810/m.94439 type:complete len:398 (+) Transcript_46810:239-1432(+)
MLCTRRTASLVSLGPMSCHAVSLAPSFRDCLIDSQHASSQKSMSCHRGCDSRALFRYSRTSPRLDVPGTAGEAEAAEEDAESGVVEGGGAGGVGEEGADCSAFFQNVWESIMAIFAVCTSRFSRHLSRTIASAAASSAKPWPLISVRLLRCWFSACTSASRPTSNSSIVSSLRRSLLVRRGTNVQGSSSTVAFAMGPSSGCATSSTGSASTSVSPFFGEHTGESGSGDRCPSGLAIRHLLSWRAAKSATVILSTSVRIRSEDSPATCSSSAELSACPLPLLCGLAGVGRRVSFAAAAVTPTRAPRLSGSCSRDKAADWLCVKSGRCAAATNALESAPLEMESTAPARLLRSSRRLVVASISICRKARIPSAMASLHRASHASNASATPPLTWSCFCN